MWDYSPVLRVLHPKLIHLSPADRRLAQQTTLLKERNQSLLKAVGSVRANPSSSTVVVGGEEFVDHSFS